MKLIRSLGFGELRMHLQHSLAGGTTQGALLVNVKGDVDLTQVNACVENIINQHEILRLCIVKHGSEYFFAENSVSNSDYVSHKVSIENNDGLGHLCAELESVIDSTKQLWKLIVYSHPGKNVTDFVLIMHHAVMDAVGSEYFFDTLFNMLGNPACISEYNKSFPIPIAMEADALSACEWADFAQAQQKLQQVLDQTNLQSHRVTCPIEGRTTKVISGELGAFDVKLLEDFCADNDFSLNSLLSTLFTRAVYKETSGRDKFALFSAVSLRPLCPNAPKKEFGCYLSVMPTLHEFDSSWSLINEAKLHKLKQHQAFMDIARWVPRAYDSAAIEKNVGDAIHAEIFKNDLGFTYAETGLKRSYGMLDVCHQYVGARRSLGNVALILHGLKCNDAIYFTLSYVEPLQDGGYANQVFRRFFTLAKEVSKKHSLTVEEI
jgi:hypothetical protein